MLRITVLSKKIAKEIEKKVQYPAEIQVTVIRENGKLATQIEN